MIRRPHKTRARVPAAANGLRQPTGLRGRSAWKTDVTPEPISEVTLFTSFASRMFTAGLVSLGLVLGSQLAVQPPASAAPPVAAPAVVRPAQTVSARPVFRLSPAQLRAARQSARLAAVVRYAKAQRGKPYRYGMSGPRSFDCSGLTLASYRRAGLRLPHSSHAQARRGTRIPKSHRRAGDLLYWPQGHVAIAVGHGKMIDAGSRRTGVSERGIWGSPRTYRVVYG